MDKLIEDPYNYAKKLSVKELVKLLRKLADAYYKGKPVVSDEVYDLLHDMLEKRDPNNAFLTEVGAKVSKNKVDLPFYLSSLTKFKPDTNDVTKWLVQYKGPY